MNLSFEMLKTDTGNGSVLRRELRFEEQPDFWELGTMIAPQNMYTPILLGVKATSRYRFASTMCAGKACIDVLLFDFILLIWPGPNKSIAGQVPEGHL